MSEAPQETKRSLFWRWYGRFVDTLSAVGLMLTIATAIYCLEIRAHYERSYAMGVIVALLGLAVMLIAWAQQVIAARDLASWREMVELQIRAAHRKIANERQSSLHGPYFEALIETLIADMRSTVEDGEADDEIAR